MAVRNDYQNKKKPNFARKKDMDHLPLNDTPMLVSAINFLLRDEEFDTLDEICFHFNINRDELEQRLASEGFQYSEEQKRFW